MTQPLERMPGLRREPNVGLMPLTDSQRTFAALMTSNPQAAFSLVKAKYDAMPATETLGVKAARIGKTPVGVSLDSGFYGERIKLAIIMDSGDIDEFMRSCGRGSERLNESFIGRLKDGLTADGEHRLQVNYGGDMLVWAFAQTRMGQRYIQDSWSEVSPQVAAQLFDLLEPRGIESADQAEAADGLNLLDDNEIELAGLIEKNPKRAWDRIKEILQPLDLKDGYPGPVRIGNTVVILKKSQWRLNLTFSGKSGDRNQIMQSYGNDGLPINIMTMLIAGINGNHDLTITADFSDLENVRLTATDWEISGSADVNPKFLAALIMRIRPKNVGSSVQDTAVQARPLGGPAFDDRATVFDAAPKPTENQTKKRHWVDQVFGPSSLVAREETPPPDLSRGVVNPKPRVIFSDREQVPHSQSDKKRERRQEAQLEAWRTEQALNELRSQGNVFVGRTESGPTSQSNNPRSRFERIARRKKKKEAGRGEKGKK